MEKTTKTFTYKLPDDYTLQTSEADSSGSWTYKGPRWYGCYISTNERVDTFEPISDPDNLTSRVNDPDIAAEFVVDAASVKGALLATIFEGNPDSDMSDSSVFPHISIPTPNGEVYKRPQPTAPNHTYDAETISYDVAAGKWREPFPWFKPFMNWDGLKGWVRSSRKLYEEKMADSAEWNKLSTSAKKEWADWDSDMANCEKNYKAAGLKAHHVVIKDPPGVRDDVYDPEKPTHDSIGNPTSF